MFDNYTFGENTEIRVGLFLLQQTGTYQEQEIRPFNVIVNDNTLSRLDNETRGGRNLGVAAMQNIAADIIRPAAMSEGVINITQGWRSRRFRFLMRVHERHALGIGSETVRVFFGYTDQCDASFTNLDPNMRIYFNSETVITECIKQGPMGPVKSAIVASANQIISPVDYQSGQNGFFNRPTSHLVRPEDVFNMGQAQHVVGMLQHSHQLGGNQHQVFVSSGMVGQGGEYKYSKRRDTSPTRYMADTLGAWQHAVKEGQMGTFDDVRPNPDILMGEAARLTANHDMRSNTFLARLRDHAGYMEQGYVTYKDLCRLFPEAARIGPHEVTNYSMDNGQGIRKCSFAEQSNHWGGADPTTIAASLLAQVVPAIMMDNFFRNMTFAATNGNVPGTYNISFNQPMCRMVVDNLVTQQYFEEFQRRVVVDVLNSITYNNQIPFQISMSSDLAGESIIDISLNGEQSVRYVAPTFTDSLYSPVITRSAELPQQISADLMHLVSQIVPIGTGTSNLGQQQPIYMPQPGAPAMIDPSNSTVNGGVRAEIEDFGLL